MRNTAADTQESRLVIAKDVALMKTDGPKWRETVAKARSDSKADKEDARKDCREFAQNFCKTVTQSGEHSFRDKMGINKNTTAPMRTSGRVTALTPLTITKKKNALAKKELRTSSCQSFSRGSEPSQALFKRQVSMRRRPAASNKLN